MMPTGPVAAMTRGGGVMRAGRQVMAMQAATLGRMIRTTAAHGHSTANDRDLLHRFADGGDQDAFATLVRRHTGLVLSVCRRALPTDQDAEDACQATFLILSKKAGTGRWQASIANWLFTTARRVARDLRRAAERRARREGQAAVQKSVAAVDRMTGRGLLAVIDEELDRLPPIYREPLLLYYQAELTRDEIAARLGIPAGTVKIRLERGRKRLGDALTRHGLVMSTGLLTLMATSRAGAAPALAIDPLPATVGVKVPPAIAALARGVAVNGVLKKSLVVLAVAGLAVLGLSSMSPMLVGQQKSPPPSSKDSAIEKRDGTKDPGPAPDAKGEKSFAGRVVDPDGKPVGGAKLYTLYWTPKVLPIPERGASDKDGSFQFAVEKKEFDGSLSARPWEQSMVVAMADGYGLGVPDFGRGKPVSESRWTVRLAKDDVPITGRILNLQGQPVVGATVTVCGLFWPVKGNDLSDYVAELREQREGYRAIRAHLTGLEGMYIGRDVGRVIPSAVTNADGRFTLQGVGRERV